MVQNGPVFAVQYKNRGCSGTNEGQDQESTEGELALEGRDVAQWSDILILEQKSVRIFTRCYWYLLYTKLNTYLSVYN